MAIRIELWAGDALIGGAEHWWDDVEATLQELDPTREAFPLLSRVDPVGDAIFTKADLLPLRDELSHLSATGPPQAVSAIAAHLIELCVAGLDATSSELHFVGD